MIAVIMAGGSGKRFWPLSRKDHPKQFLKITGEKSMIQLTVDRLLKKIKIEDIYVVTADDQANLVYEQLPELPHENLILEPFGRNTAPCIGLSARFLSRKYKKDEVMFVLPADHVIEDTDKFLKSLDIGEKTAKKGNLVTFGIRPDFPATGYGYIESAKKIDTNVYEVKQFKEKPDLQQAIIFQSMGIFYWNSGMFMWTLDTILNSFKTYLPKIDSLLTEINDLWEKEGAGADLTNCYGRMPKIPVDIGIMEQAEKRVVVPVSYGWSDVGSWRALYEISPKDDNENVVDMESVSIIAKKNYVNAKKMVALIGVENLVIVDTEDCLLVADKNHSEKVKDAVNQLEERKLTKYC